MNRYETDQSGYGNRYGSQEYNPNGDIANGYTGTVMPGAVANQVSSSTPSTSKNPYAEILNYLPPVQAPAAASVVNPDAPSTPKDPTLPIVTGGPSVGQKTPPPAQVDTRGRAVAPPVQYSNSNPPPRPADMSDPAVAAAYYRNWGTNQGLTGYNQLFANITGDDVNTQRNLAVGGKFAAMGHPEYQDFGTWYLAGKPMPPTDPGPTTPITPDPAKPISGSSGGTSYGMPPGQNQPIAPQQSSDYSGILKQLQDLMAGQNTYEHTQLNRGMDARAAALGDFQSGGYGEINARANAQLTANEGDKLSGYLNQDWQSSLDRALQQYGINSSAASARYSADASLAGAGASAGASRYATDAALREAMIRDQTQRYQGDQSYNLGLAGLGLDQYKFDNPSINALLGMYLQMSPEQLAQFASNPQLFPGYYYQPHA